MGAAIPKGFAAMSASLSPAQLETYRAQGIVHPLPALPQAEAAALRGRYEAQAGFLKGRNNQKPHLLFTWLVDRGRALVSRPAVQQKLSVVTGVVLLLLGVAVAAGA